MKICSGYILQQVMDTWVLIGVGDEAFNHGEIINLNETGAFLWRLLEKGAGKQELIEKLAKECDMEPEAIRLDVDAFLKKLQDAGVIIEKDAIP